MISNPIAFSTCCNSHRHKNGYDMLEEIAGLGFEWAELSHGIGFPWFLASTRRFRME
jgi:hypothetical protein